MIDRCNIGMRQARDDFSILSLFFFNYVIEEEPFPCLPLDYELCRPLSYWAVLPEAKNPHRGTMLMSDFTDRELTLIKQWEIHFQRKEAAWRDKTTLRTRLTARWCARGRMHQRWPVHTHERTDMCVQTLMSETGLSLWKYKTSCCSFTGRTLQHGAVWAADWELACLLSSRRVTDKVEG